MCDDVCGEESRLDASAGCVEILRVVFAAGPLIQPHQKGAETREKGTKSDHHSPSHPLDDAGEDGGVLEMPKYKQEEF